ncbi:MAG: GNAT family N-acetyltransferase [Chloroflexi bacterium]|nr:GNAT family N-acetyltransferase [Chloroflexota bacterium]
MTETAPVAAEDVGVVDAPAIPDLVFRRYRGAQDIPELVRLRNAVSKADDHPEVTTVAELAAYYANLTNSDPARDMVVAEVDGRLVADNRVAWSDTTDGQRTYELMCHVDPEYRRRGLGRALLRHNERRIREIAAGHVAAGRPPDSRWFQAWAYDTEVAARALFLQEGYTSARHFYEMVRPHLDNVSRPVVPEGLEVRPGDAEQARQIFEADAEAFQDHWGDVDASEAAFRRWVDDPAFDPSLWQIAWDGDQVAGLVVNAIYPAENETNGYLRGWLDSVAVRRPWRKRGLARALIVSSLRLIRERGMTSAALGVDTQNPNQALHLYEDTGFRVERSATVYRKALDET